MKYRNDFVTNSSSSSFIITNKSNETMYGEDIVLAWLSQVLKDAAEYGLSLHPGESIELKCTDHADENAFEAFIHHAFDGWSYVPVCEDKVSAKFLEGHH